MIPETAEVGDFFVVRTGGIVGALIRLVTRSQYNHAGIYMPPNATMCVEANPAGASLDPSDYGKDLLLASKILITPQQRLDIQQHAQEVIGVKYGFLDLVSLAALQFGIKPKFIRRQVTKSNRMICSQLVDEVYRRAGVHLFNDGRLSQDVTPGDLARLIEITPHP